MPKKAEKFEPRVFKKMTEDEAKRQILSEGYVNLKKETIVGFIKQFHGDEDREWFKAAYEYKDEYELKLNEETGKKEKIPTGKKSNRATYNAVTGRKLFWKKYGFDKLSVKEKPLTIDEAFEADFA